MKDLLPDDRPREKLLRNGAAALGDNELVALVVGSGTRRAGALALANELLRCTGGVRGLARSKADDLARISGVGPARAAKVVAALELGRRTLTHGHGARVQLRSPREAAEFLLDLGGRRHQVITAVAVRRGDKVWAKESVSAVKMKRLSDIELNAYLASNEWQGKAGSYAIQGLASSFIPSINGSYSNVVGLPLAETAAMLEYLIKR